MSERLENGSTTETRRARSQTRREARRKEGDVGAPGWAWAVATGLGSGWLRPAPGTWGSFTGLGAWCLVTFALTSIPLHSVVLEGLFLLAIGRLAHRILVSGEWRGALLLVAPFLVFRVLDIWKPWPVDQIQDLPDGQGIVADDLVAGLYGLPLVALVTPWVMGWVGW